MSKHIHPPLPTPKHFLLLLPCLVTMHTVLASHSITHTLPSLTICLSAPAYLAESGEAELEEEGQNLHKVHAPALGKRRHI